MTWDCRIQPDQRLILAPGSRPAASDRVSSLPTGSLLSRRKPRTTAQRDNRQPHGCVIGGGQLTGVSVFSRAAAAP